MPRGPLGFHTGLREPWVKRIAGLATALKMSLQDRGNILVLNTQFEGILLQLSTVRGNPKGQCEVNSTPRPGRRSHEEMESPELRQANRSWSGDIQTHIDCAGRGTGEHILSPQSPPVTILFLANRPHWSNCTRSP